MRVAYGKLVRDRIPEIIESHGHRAVTYTLAEDSYRTALLAKLGEEAHEAQQATADDLPAELADVLEVLQALTAACDLTWEQLQELADDKRARRGGFQRRIFLDYVDQPA
jgi:predicted house-cleaning noncanonical NTP pyrophosphatase (MazG superfamily)